MVKKKLMRFPYGETPETNLSILMFIACVPVYYANERNLASIIFKIACLIIMSNAGWNILLNRKRKYLACNHSLIKRNCIWINQKLFPVKDADICPRHGFMNELENLLKSIPKGTICFCCTHNSITDQIMNKFPDVNMTPIYRKNLKKLKKSLISKKCKQCNKQKCPIYEDEIKQFYAVKFKA